MVPESFHDFFAAGASASGALIGLLFVAVSVAPERTVSREAPLEAQTIAASAFTAFANTLFITLAALIPGGGIAAVTITVGGLGLVSTLTLVLILWRHRALARLSRRWPYLLGIVAAVYATELSIGISLNGATGDLSRLRALSGLMLALYAVGLLRTWELLGARNLGLRDTRGRSQQAETAPETAAGESGSSRP